MIPVTDDMIKKIEKMASRGLTMEQIANNLGMDTSTLYDKKNDYPEISDAIKRGKANGIKQVTNFLFKNAKGGNVTAQIFYLKCRAKWREEDEVQKSNELEKIKEEILKLGK